MSHTHYTSLREFLIFELASRQSRNPKYSLRAFSMSLNMDHSTVSQYMRGKREFSPLIVRRICVALKLETEDLTHFCTQATVSQLNRRNRPKTMAPLPENLIPSDYFSLNVPGKEKFGV